MPRGDHTGPQGMGAMSGRGAGYCNGFERPGLMHRFSQGGGSGIGSGFGGRHRGARMGMAWVKPEVVPESQHDLKQQVQDLERELNALKSRILQMDQESTQD